MIIKAASTEETFRHKVILFSKLEDLAPLELSDQERQYIGQDEERSLSLLNRYQEQFYLVRVAKEERLAQRREQTRLKGVALLSSLKHEKAESVKISSLNDQLDSLDLAEGLVLSNYQFLKYYSDREKRQSPLKQVHVQGADSTALKMLNASLKGVYLARDLVNEPLSTLTAEALAQAALDAGQASGFEVDVFNQMKIESLKMGGLLAVNRGSQDPPTFTVMEYKPEAAKNQKPIVLVGKGVVYDTGGMSLKPTAGSMDSMKSDMGGAAAVIGTMTAIAEAQLPIHVIALVPATDNRPGENAYVPGDVVKMYDGSTVEVLNTDAEGRMLLADALAYAKKYQPELVFDLATLTGAAAVAIGKYGVVAMGTAKDQDFDGLSKAGDAVYERPARFPFWEEYNDLLKSSIADVKNIGGREAGAITAGKFLERFTDYPWIHIDIAGPAFLNADDQYRLKGGTGVGVRLLFEFLRARS